MRTSYRKQAGVTIVEVLFAIGIVIMGLMGIGGLIMIAGTQLTQGLKADGMSNLGLNAIEEFDMRHLRRQDLLVSYDESTATFVKSETAESYCIDPYFISRQVVNNNKNSAQFSSFPGIRVPPRNPTQLAVMPRMTIANPVGIINNPAIYDPNIFGAGVASIMNELLAQELFTAQDNLAIRLSDIATELPQQVWFDDRPSPLANSIRMVDGIDNDYDGIADEKDEAYVKRIGFGDMARLGATEYSWMATLTPHRSFMVHTSGTSAGTDRTDQYLVSIVVFHNRVLNQNTTTREHQERMLRVTLRGNGFGGGEVRLHGSSSAALDLKHGDWIMLSAQSSMGPQFRWYKVTYIDDELQQLTKNFFYRDATLQGPDWNRAEWLPKSARCDCGKKIPLPPDCPTYATFIPHVIGVFEKTIRMETTSLY